jgi:hypothetical protein
MSDALKEFGKEQSGSVEAVAHGELVIDRVVVAAVHWSAFGVTGKGSLFT